jgi:regulator of protease activity HflC (stomatin/prohibitin superfamily)
MANPGRARAEALALIARAQAPVQLTRAAIRLALDWNALPENERAELARAVAMRAAWWRKSDAQQAAADRRTYETFAGTRSLIMWRPCGNGGTLPRLDDDAEDDDDD